MVPPRINGPGKNHFICKCMDVTYKEATDSIEEGFDQVETLKRFTSMGMGPCQGKSCHEAVARLAALGVGAPEGTVFPTTMRPPFCPVPFGVLAGRSHHLVPVRRTAMHHCHIRAQAAFLNSGQWKRPFSYIAPQEEAKKVRNGLGIIDVSTLGKLGIKGPDAMEFIHFMLPGKYRKLAVGKTRYSTMIGEDGILFEDVEPFPIFLRENITSAPQLGIRTPFNPFFGGGSQRKISMYTYLIWVRFMQRLIFLGKPRGIF